jgi:2'-5' RNA ligase
MTPDLPMRLFIALPLPEDTHHALGRIIQELKRASAAVRWVHQDHIHLTLRFLGDTDQSLVPQLKQLIDTKAHAHAALTVTLDRLGAFPNLRNPRVYWISASDQVMVNQLQNLAAQIEQGVRELGFEPEKKLFKPHLTLGRVKQPDNLERLGQLIETYRLPSLRVPLSTVVLFHSTLTPQGPIYRRLHESPLGVERFE